MGQEQQKAGVWHPRYSQGVLWHRVLMQRPWQYQTETANIILKCLLINKKQGPIMWLEGWRRRVKGLINNRLKFETALEQFLQLLTFRDNLVSYEWNDV